MKNILLMDLGDLRGELNEPLGIECISSRVVRELNINVDMVWYNMSNSLCSQELLQYDLIGVSMNIGTLPRFEEIYSYMQVYRPQLPLVLGGCIPTFAYRELIEKYNNVICIYGEGERAFYDLVVAYRNSILKIDNRLMSIGNLAFKMDNREIITAKLSLNLELEGPVVRNQGFLEYIKKKHGIVRIEGSRGCSWSKCSFCCVNAKYANPCWRGFSIDKIIKELIEISNMGFHAPYFTDEDFFGQNYSRAIKLGKQIIELKEQGIIRKDMNFFIAILVADAVCEAGKEALTVLKQAGLREVFLGIESFEKDQLLRYHKKASVDTNKRALEFIAELGLTIDSGYILFDPAMSFEALGINIDYIRSLEMNRFDSRSLKRLRLQPLTTISTSLSGTIVGKLDVNNLEYPYKFLNEKVDEVYRRYKTWEDIDLEHTWLIQSVSRGEINEQFRNELKSILSKIRNVDFEVLCTLYSLIENNTMSFQDNKLLKYSRTQKNKLIQEAFQLIRAHL